MRPWSVCAVALLLAGAASAQAVAETQRVVLSGRPAGGALALFFPWEEPILVDMPSTITALTVAAVATRSLTAYFNGSMTATVTIMETPAYTLTIVFSKGVPQLMADTSRLLPAGLTATVSTASDLPSAPSCQEAAAAVLRCHATTMPDMDPSGMFPISDGPHRMACCRNASLLIPACGGTPETLFAQWPRITGNFDVNMSSTLMSYVGACPRARADLTRAAVPEEQCRARVQGALACANEVLSRQYFAPMPPRDVVASVSQSCCRNVTGLQYACLGRDLDSLTSPAPLAVLWTVPASQQFYLGTYNRMLRQPVNSSVTSGMDPNAVSILRRFLVTAGVVWDITQASFFNITVTVDPNNNAQFTIEFPWFWGEQSPSSDAPYVYMVGMDYGMPVQLRPFGWSRDAAVLRFLIDGHADQLVSQLGTSFGGGPMGSMYNMSGSTSFPDLTCPAYPPNFCAAALQLTYTCMSTTIADRRGATAPVCVRLANMIDGLCQGYPWRALLGAGNVTLTPPPLPPATLSDAYRGIFRLSELNQLDHGDCDWTIEGMKVSASGRVYSDRCPAANGAQCMSTRPALIQFGVPYYEVGSLAMMPGYQPRSPECGADN